MSPVRQSEDKFFYENIVEPLVSKELWENCQSQKKKNQKNHMRTQRYIFLQKLRCSNRKLTNELKKQNNTNDLLKFVIRDK